MHKPIELMTPSEKARLKKHLQTLVKAEGDFAGVLGNRNSFLIARRGRSWKTTAPKAAKASA